MLFRSRRSEIVAQLQKGLDGIRNAQPIEMATDLARLEEQRRTLNAHVQALHCRVDPWGQSLYQVMQEALELADLPTPTLRFRSSILQHLTQEQMNRLVDMIQEASFRPELFLGTAPTPWASARPLTSARVAEILEAAEALIPLLENFENLVHTLASRLGIRPPTSFSEGERLLALAERIESFKKLYSSKIIGDGVLALTESLRPASKGLGGRGLSWLL